MRAVGLALLFVSWTAVKLTLPGGFGTGSHISSSRIARPRSVAELRPLRREAPLAAPPPAAREAAPAPAAAPVRSAPAAEEKGEDFVSPFEDELDIPTFLRRRREEASSDDDREVPAFLRRSAD